MGIMKIYNMGIIGFGGMAGHHYNQCKKFEKINVKGVYDINPERGEYAKSIGLVSYNSADELINDPEIDIVLVSTTNDTHKELVIKALKADKNVICEKPATIHSKDLEEMIEAAKTSRGKFTVDQNRRVNKDFVLMRRQVESGIIGKPYVFESRVEGSRGMPAGWRQTKALGGGMMLDWGVHLIDQMMYMFYDNKVVNIYCKMFSIQYPEVDDNFRLTMEFDNGIVAHIEVSTNNFISHPRWYVLGTEGTLQIDGWDCNGKVVKCLEREDKWGVDIKKTKAGPSKTMAPRDPDTVETILLEEPTDVEDNLNPVYKQLIDAIEGKAELKIKPEEALRVIKVMEACFESAETGNTIKTNI